MNWIMSEGGPLLCLEKNNQRFWGGVDALTVASDTAEIGNTKMIEAALEFPSTHKKNVLAAFLALP